MIVVEILLGALLGSLPSLGLLVWARARAARRAALRTRLRAGLLR